MVKVAFENTENEYYRTLALLDLYEKEYNNAVGNIEKASLQEFKDIAGGQGDVYLLKAKIYKHARSPLEAKAFYKMAVDYFSDQIRFNPEDYSLYSKLGIAYAGTDEEQQALKQAKTAIVNCSLQENHLSTLHTLYNLIQLYALADEYESAQHMARELLSRNTFYTKEYLRLDPDIQHILDDSIF